ncbi:MAG: ABC transporter permease subunit, partial [Chitinivibrionales bacterium]|nr:ABC transporter permease subunit [Chitinivibrionales bacterium]
MIRTVAAYETASLLKSARFAIALILCSTAFVLVAIGQRTRNDAAVRDYRSGVDLKVFRLRSATPLEARLLDPYGMHSSAMPPPMGALFASPFRVDVAWSKVPRAPVEALTISVDLGTCAAMLLGLVALVLSFDALSAGAHRAPTTLLLSCGVSRAQVLLGIALARVGLVTLIFVCSTLLAALAAWPSGTSEFAGQHWLALLAFVAGGVLYIA